MLCCLDCKTVVFGRFRKAQSAVSVTLECEADSVILECEADSRFLASHARSVSPHSPSPFLHSLQTFLSNIDLSFEYGRTIAYRRSCPQKIRLFCSLSVPLHLDFFTFGCFCNINHVKLHRECATKRLRNLTSAMSPSPPTHSPTHYGSRLSVNRLTVAPTWRTTVLVTPGLTFLDNGKSSTT